MTVKVNQATASQIPSDALPPPGVKRGKRGANPVNATASGHRETAPLSKGATPRVMHPALNGEPWSRTYAQSREQPRGAGNKAKRNSNRRMKSVRKKEGR
jgi:hypothetical protein